MPEQLAIKVSEATIDKIMNQLPYDVTESFVKMTLQDAKEEGTSYYIVTNAVMLGKSYPFLVFTRQGMLDDFASMPPGIDDQFVKVTQVKEGS